MNADATSRTLNPQCHDRSFTKPFTVLESQAKALGDAYLELARLYHANRDLNNAVSCCLEGLNLIFGISRPLAVRDQLHELLQTFDRTCAVSEQIQMCMRHAAWHAAGRHSVRTTRGGVLPTYLERLISAHQLVSYPSDDRDFNRAYEEALSYLKRNHSVGEVYIVTYRPALSCNRTVDYFHVVPAAMISKRGPYYLTDICGVVRK